MKFGRARVPEQAIPRLGSDTHYACEAGFEVAKFNRTDQRHDVSTERPHHGAVVRARVYCHDEEDRGARERRRYRLRNRPRFNSGFRSSHGNWNSIERIQKQMPQISSVSPPIGSSPRWVTAIVSPSFSKPRTNLLTR